MKVTKILLLICVVVGFCGCQVLRILTATDKISLEMIPFERDNPDAKLRLLFLGDSTAVGTGARNNTFSVAGWFGQNYRQAHIRNISQNGRTLEGLVENYPSDGETYTLAVLQIGGNDILKFSRFSQVEKYINEAVDRTKEIADHVVIMHSGNVGLAPIFSWPLNHVYTSRTKKLRAIYINQAKEKGVIYIDLFKEKGEDVLLQDVEKYYSADHLHPSGDGYRYWYDEIQNALNKNNITL